MLPASAGGLVSSSCGVLSLASALGPRRAWAGPGALGGAVPGGSAVRRAADVLSEGRVVGGMGSPRCHLHPEYKYLACLLAI